MKSLSDKNDIFERNSSNGLITKFWGPSGWTFGHSITFGYPINPTDSDKLKFKKYFTDLGDILPCCHCRDSYKYFINNGTTKLVDSVFDSRESLTFWFYNLHQEVNKKLNVDYGITFDEVKETYENFRAVCPKDRSKVKGCISPLHYKAFSYKKLYLPDPPLLQFYLVSKFVGIAKKRGIDNKYFVIYDCCKSIGGNIYKLKKDNILWSYRNQFCYNKIKKMRIKATNSIETSGKFINLPTVDELILILFFSSNLDQTKLSDLSLKL
jgi:hypothetical protein